MEKYTDIDCNIKAHKSNLCKVWSVKEADDWRQREINWNCCYRNFFFYFIKAKYVTWSTNKNLLTFRCRCRLSNGGIGVPTFMRFQFRDSNAIKMVENGKRKYYVKWQNNKKKKSYRKLVIVNVINLMPEFGRNNRKIQNYTYQFVFHTPFSQHNHLFEWNELNWYPKLCIKVADSTSCAVHCVHCTPYTFKKIS